MAWKGKVAATSVSLDAAQFYVSVDYYDDTNPGVMLVRRVLPFDSGASPAEIQTQVKQTGSRERRVYLALASLSAQVAVGTELLI